MIATVTLSRPELPLARYYVHELALMNALFLQGGEGAPRQPLGADRVLAGVGSGSLAILPAPLASSVVCGKARHKIFNCV